MLQSGLPDDLRLDRVTFRDLLVRRHGRLLVWGALLHGLLGLLMLLLGVMRVPPQAYVAGAALSVGGALLCHVLSQHAVRQHRDLQRIALLGFLWVTLWLLASAWGMSAHRVVIMVPFFAILALASFRIQLGGLILLALVGGGGYLLVLLGLEWVGGGLAERRLEWLQGLMFAMTVASFVWTGSAVITLRNKLTRRSSDLGQALQQVQKLALRDELTGLFNRRHIMDVLQHQQAMAAGKPYCFSLCLVDLDHFKRINDQFGHGIGDQVLMRFAAWVRIFLREADYVGRFGGEEFVLVLTNTGVPGAVHLAERLRAGLARLDLDDLTPGLRLTASIGISEYHWPEPLTTLIARADQCLYLAKSQGRDRVVHEDLAMSEPQRTAPSADSSAG